MENNEYKLYKPNDFELNTDFLAMGHSNKPPTRSHSRVCNQFNYALVSAINYI